MVKDSSVVVLPKLAGGDGVAGDGVAGDGAAGGENQVGDLAIDCTHLAEFLQDLPAGKLVGLRRRRSGYKDVVGEVLSNQAAIGGKAGLTGEDIALFVETNRRIDRIDAVLPAVRKLLEILDETRAQLDDKCQRQVTAFATSVQMRAKVHDDPTLLAKYEKTCRYRSAIAVKGAKTRRKNRVAAAKQPVQPPS